MVLEDLSHFHHRPLHRYFKLAFVADRLLAFVFDLILLSPVVGLFISGLYKRIQLLAYTRSEDYSLNLSLLVAAVFIFLFVSLMQSLFLLLWQATPGQIFFKIKIVSIDDQNIKLGLPQILLRSFVFTGQFLLFGIPFLVVVGDKHRRGLHDRISGTLAVTLKREGDLGPTPFETQFVQKTLLASSVLAIAMVSMMVANTYRQLSPMASQMDAVLGEEQDHSCGFKKNQTISARRLDQIIAGYLSKEIQADCLDQYLKAAFLSDETEILDWAYLAKWFANQNEHKLAEQYLAKVCHTDDVADNTTSEDSTMPVSACLLLKWQMASQEFQVEKSNATDRSKSQIPISMPINQLGSNDIELVLSTWTGLLLSYKHDLQNGDFQQSEKKLIALAQLPDGSFFNFKDFVAENIVHLRWLKKDNELALGAYETAYLTLSTERKNNLSAWLCYEQSFSQDAVSCLPHAACLNLQNDLRQNANVLNDQNQFVDLAILALAKRTACGQATHLLPQFLSENSSINALVEAIISKNNEKLYDSLVSWTRSQKLNQSTVAMQDSLDWFSLSAREVSLHLKDEKQIQLLQQFLSKQNHHDYVWYEIYSRTLDAAARTGSVALVEDLTNMQLTHASLELKQKQVIALYSVNAFDRAWEVIREQNLLPRSRQENAFRSPAAVDESNSFEIIYGKLRKRFQP